MVSPLLIVFGSVDATSTFVARPLFETPVILVAAPELFERFPRPADANALARVPCIARRIDDTWTVGDRRVPVTGPVTVNTFEAARDAALAGLGVAMVPAPVVHADLTTGTLVHVLRTGRTVRFAALWPSRRLPMRVRLFYDVLVRQAAELARSIDALARQ